MWNVSSDCAISVTLVLTIVAISKWQKLGIKLGMMVSGAERLQGPGQPGLVNKIAFQTKPETLRLSQIFIETHLLLILFYMLAVRIYRAFTLTYYVLS